MAVVDSHQQLGFPRSPGCICQLSLVVHVDQPVRTTQQVVGTICLSRHSARIGIFGWFGNLNDQAHSVTVQPKVKLVPRLGISKRPFVPLIMSSSSCPVSGAAPWSTSTKRSRLNSG
jgi:hypothetical protein